MERDFGYVTKLRLFYILAGLVMLGHAILLMAMGINFGNLLFDTCAKRLGWDFWRIYGNNIGWISVIAAYFLLWHTLFGLYYWIVFGTSIIIGIVHIVCAVTYISDQIDCDGTIPCVGCQAPGVVDWPWILHWILVGICGVISLIAYAGMVIYLRSRVEFSMYLSVAADSRYNPNTLYVTPPGGVGSTLPTYLGGMPATTPAYAQISTTAPAGAEMGAEASKPKSAPFREAVISSNLVNAFLGSKNA